jgi:hypothetical protein
MSYRQGKNYHAVKCDQKKKKKKEERKKKEKKSFVKKHSPASRARGNQVLPLAKPRSSALLGDNQSRRY